MLNFLLFLLLVSKAFLSGVGAKEASDVGVTLAVGSVDWIDDEEDVQLLSED